MEIAEEPQTVQPVVETEQTNEVAEQITEESLVEAVAEGEVVEPQALASGKILEDYKAQYDNDIPLAKDEVVYIWEMDNENWWKVQTSAGIFGYVPSSFIEVLEDYRYDYNQDGYYAEEAHYEEGAHEAEYTTETYPEETYVQEEATAEAVAQEDAAVQAEEVQSTELQPTE